MDLDQLLDLIIKAQRSSMKSGAEKKTWVMAQIDEDPALALSATIDWVLMILKDPQVHSLFAVAGRSCADRLCRGRDPVDRNPN